MANAAFVTLSIHYIQHCGLYNQADQQDRSKVELDSDENVAKNQFEIFDKALFNAIGALPAN